MKKINNYVLIDPFNSLTSGVTTYTQCVFYFLIKKEITTQIIAINEKESLPEFRQRVAKEISNLSLQGLLVEAPESLYATRELHSSIPVHIRLHGSREFGNWLQRNNIDDLALKAEQQEISRAILVTAPSRAAIETSRKLFNYPEKICCYPNPIPEIENLFFPCDIDLLFLGRWQPLKGIKFFQKIISLLPEKRIAIASAIRPKKLPLGVIHIPLNSVADKYKALSRSRVVVIPSLFESASMVGLEALATQRPIIAWSHLGISEYAKEPCLYRVEPWSAIGMADAFQKALSLHSKEFFINSIQSIHSGFSEAMNKILDDGDLSISTMPIQLEKQNFDNIFLNLHSKKMKANNLSIFFRKWRKLLRDPAAFWRDSFLYILYKKIRSDNHSVIASDYFDIDSRNLPELSDSNPLPALLGHLGSQGRINLKDPIDKPKGWVTTIVHTAADTEEVLNLCAGLNQYKDFSPLRTDSLKRILTEVDHQEPVISILNRIDMKNKERIARIDNIIVVNPTANVLEALRCCGTRNKTILILIESIEDDFSLLVANADAVICLSSHPAAALNWRRKNCIENLDQLPGILRRVIQEIGPKNPDMLLPLIGGTAYNPSLITFDSRRYQGIIRLESSTVPRVQNLREYIKHLSANVSEMLILDSIYMRYRSLCEEVEAGSSPAALIEACLQDGVLFDVH